MSTVASPIASRAAQAGTLIALCAAALALVPLHGDAWWPAAPDGTRTGLAALLSAAWLVASGLTLRRARRAARTQAARSAADAGVPEPADWLVVHASQTGQALELAQRTAGSLQAAGLRVRLREISSLDAATLSSARQALFVASTTGEGDAPDPAAGFIRATMREDLRLPTLRYAVLALGDRGYRNYCAFGHALDRWLQDAGATPLFDLVEVDNADPAALRHWQHHVGTAAGASGLPDWAPVAYEAWTLAARRELNPGSAGAPVFELRLTPPAGDSPRWRAGDIAEIGPRQDPAAVDALLAAARLDGATRVQRDGVAHPLADLVSRSQLPPVDGLTGIQAQALADRLQPLPSREYSIASIPGEGTLRLLLRRMLRPDGTPGVGSGWLCDHAPLGGTVDLRVRANPGFHGPPAQRPLVLLGNGTGIAGLRAHLAERAADDGARSWLLFGERHADRDFHLREDILGWLADGTLARLDLAFSRGTDGAALPPSALAADRAAIHAGHVQGALRLQAARLRQWVDDGAALLVCGSLQGMAPGVDAELRAILGSVRVDDLLASGRYRRDVY
ncbi:sulfite reductase subunit alpha [Luteimonas sp. MC1750]|uniref:sulfite reductase subunit alpha n=1 Tax=Luteimonas sp. MC1750 TaxID=2799326 RepID=UPI001F1E3335|nr:sulfite reductase subunit alpha [Luteimonas sp. MC1750]